MSNATGEIKIVILWVHELQALAVAVKVLRETIRENKDDPSIGCKLRTVLDLAANVTNGITPDKYLTICSVGCVPEATGNEEDV
jgi:hypothetical protein